MKKLIAIFAFSIYTIGYSFGSKNEREKPFFHYPGYTIEYLDNGYKIYNGDTSFSSNLEYTVEYSDQYYKVYKGNSSFSSNLIYFMSREALQFFEKNKISQKNNMIEKFLFQPQLSFQNKQTDFLSNSIISLLMDLLLK